jgi:hypothetical protein
MAHSVKSFVETLQADGVAVGRQAAEKIRREAEEQAQQVVRDAEAKAAKILEDAERERQVLLDRTRIDLELAARDTVARLRDVLGRAVNRLITRAASTTLDDSEFLKELIREVASVYAQSDAVGEKMLQLNVSEPMERKLCDWAIASFHHEGGDEPQLAVELHGALTTAGFEYKIHGGTVELTPESVVQVLSQIVTPKLQELIVSSQQNPSQQNPSQQNPSQQNQE